MVHQPLIRFRYALQKAATAGCGNGASSVARMAPRRSAQDPVRAAPKKIPSPPNVTRTSRRIDMAPTRARISDEEMEAIMVRYNILLCILWRPISVKVKNLLL